MGSPPEAGALEKQAAFQSEYPRTGNVDEQGTPRMQSTLGRGPAPGS